MTFLRRRTRQSRRGPASTRGPVPARAAVALLTASALLVPAAAAVAAPAAPTATESDDAAAAAVEGPLVDLVNPFIGTKDDGNTYPGAAVPFGMVQLSPDNGHNVGYDHDRTSVRGFSLVHLSGVGCGLGGPLPVLPTTGAVTATDYASYALPYTHDDEEASPGYYRVGLQSAAGTIEAELTASERTGVQRYTFPATEQANVLLNTGQALNRVTSSEVRVVDDRTVETEITVRGFCQDTEPQTIWTRTTFDRPFTAHGTWDGDTVTAGSDAASGGEQRRGAYVTFDTTGGDLDVEAVTAMSYVGADGAAANLVAEAGTFDAVHDAARSAWEDRLGLVQVGQGDETDLRTFYSSLYRSFLAPNTASDVDGRYRGWDQEVHTAGVEGEPGTYYQNYSLWDTYRTQQQLLYLLAPKESADMALSLVRQAEQGGWLPRWGYGTVETNIMTGDPATPFLVSAWQQGLLAGHEEEAYAVLRQNADGVPPEDSPFNGRAANVEYLRDGFVPHEPARSGKPGDYDLQHGGSATMEYALADAMLSTMARGLGHVEDADRYAARGQSYRNVFDPRTENFRARSADGFFVGDPDPAHSDGFHEGTAVQYQWLVPQDVPGLFDLMGGTDAAIDRLDAFFAYDELVEDPARVASEVWVNGTYDYYGWETYNPNNEPNLHAPYVYLWTGQPWKTTDVVRAAATLFTDGPDGVTGNDDLGTMSAWHVLSSIGVYPIVPGTDLWGLTTPLFDDVTITLDPDVFGRDALHLTADGVAPDAHYTQSVSLGGEALDRAWVTGDELTSAGTLDVTVGSEPSAWATAPEVSPGAVVPADGTVERLFVGATPRQPVLAPGGQTEVAVQVVAQGEGTSSGTLEVTSDGAVTATTDLAEWSAMSDGLPATVEGTVTLSAPADAEPGSHVVRLVVRDAAGTEAVREIQVVVSGESWIAGAFDNVGIGDAGAANADLDGTGAYLLRDLLADLGVVQGLDLTVPGTDLTYLLGAPPAGEPDNVAANGQVLEVPEAQRGTSTLSLVGTATHGTQRGDLVLGFADGTSETVQVALSDWCTGSPEPDNILVAKPGARGNGTGTDRFGCGLYATAPVSVPDGKVLTSLTLPVNTRLHVFAVATDATGVAPAPQVEVTAQARCLGGRAFVAVRAVNTGEQPAAIELATDFGAKAFPQVAPGASAYQSFAVRAAQVEEGEVTVTVTTPDGEPQQVTAVHPAITCS
ncbi:GH92 family glycosyl hydrolase [Cellulosimicrobium sp. Marseille-Q4280]|uniref:GH92 family glycosyl hydrolase n=1 Tax=Cellulosimicrobium sp. Marseille-Q4280 TaxID=2937992 RepID=UPI00203D3216|nr:GH92 family glycosyl hydrolase [Cellulosimicrobium sp. Marseille-Q4280]